MNISKDSWAESAGSGAAPAGSIPGSASNLTTACRAVTLSSFGWDNKETKTNRKNNMSAIVSMDEWNQINAGLPPAETDVAVALVDPLFDNQTVTAKVTGVDVNTENGTVVRPTFELLNEVVSTDGGVYKPGQSWSPRFGWKVVGSSSQDKPEAISRDVKALGMFLVAAGVLPPTVTNARLQALLTVAPKAVGQTVNIKFSVWKGASKTAQNVRFAAPGEASGVVKTLDSAAVANY